MELSPLESLKIRSPIDTWTTKEHLNLTSAVSQNGEQNWAAVSRAVRLLNTDTSRPQDWFSTKNCALQYAKLLEQVDTPKRKREKNEDQQSETPGQSVHRMIKKKRIEELKSLMEEEKKQYLQLKKDVTLLESNHSESVLHHYWDGIMQEQNREDEVARKKQEFYREREEKLKKIFATRFSFKGASPFSAFKKRISPVKPSVVMSSPQTSPFQSPAKISPQLSDDASCSNLEEVDKESEISEAEENILRDQMGGGRNAQDVDVDSDSKILSFEVKEEEDMKSFDGFGISPVRSEISKTAEMPPSLESSMPLDYVSNLTATKEDDSSDMASESEQNLEVLREPTCIQGDHDYIQEIRRPPPIVIKTRKEEGIAEVTSESEGDLESQQPNFLAESLKGEDSPNTVHIGDGTLVDQEDEEEEKKAVPVIKEPKDEYEFDDDASRDSSEVKEYMNRAAERKKFSFGESVASPVISEDTPSSPASTNYGDDPEAEKLHRSWKRSIMLVWNDIAAHKNASVFLKPISEERVPGYHSIVYRPLDLITIKRMMESGAIRTTLEFQRDVMIMFLNAKMYNKRGHNVYQMAHEMMKETMDTIEEFIQAQMVAKVNEAPQKHLRRETRESLSKRGTTEDSSKRKRDDKEEKSKRRKI